MLLSAPGRYLHSIGYSRSSPPAGTPWRASEGPEQYIRRGCPASGPGSPSQDGSVTPRQPRTSFLGGKGGSCDGEIVNGFLGRVQPGGGGPATDRPGVPVLGAAGSGWWSRGVRGPDGRQ